MKLYFSKGACSLAVRILVNELQIPCEYEMVNLKTKKTESGADYYQINPKGAVPALQLDNQSVLTENAAIQIYLAETHHAEKLLPALGNNRYRVLEWLTFVATDMHKGCSPFFNSMVPDDIKEKVFQPIMKNKFNYLEQHLAKNKYLVGDHLTLPDIYLFVILTWMPGLKLDLAQYPTLTRYFQQIKTHDSVSKSLKEEGLA